MKNQSKTYRFFALFTGVLLIASILFPPVLMATHCSIDNKDLPTNTMTGEYCPLMGVSNSSASDTNVNSQDDCDLILSCACSFDYINIKTEAVPTVEKTIKIIASVTHFTNTEATAAPVYFVETAYRQNVELLPLFLLNSVFLN